MEPGFSASVACLCSGTKSGQEQDRICPGDGFR